MKKQNNSPFPDASVWIGRVQTEKLKLPRYRHMSKKKADECRYYRKFFIEKGLPAHLIPFFPYYAINPKYLTAPLMRVYLGKETPGDKNEFLLITVPCSETKQQSGKVYKEQHKSGNSYAKATITNYCLVDFRNYGSKIKVTYRNVEETETPQLKRYVQNFLDFLTRYDLQQYFAYAFMLRKLKTDLHQHIKVRPIIKTVLEHGMIVEQKVKFEVVENGTETCCQSPPERDEEDDLIVADDINIFYRK